MITEDEYRAAARAARRRGKSLAHLVREGLRRTVAEAAEGDPDARIAAVLRFARHGGPTGDIDRLLAEIERGRGLP